MSNEVDDALAAATIRLKSAGIENPRSEARRLLAHSLDVSAQSLLVGCDLPVPADVFAAHVAERVRGRPFAQIVGSRHFWAHEFVVTADVLIPRPETELLVEHALATLKERTAPALILDLGVGSGAILLSILGAQPDAKGWGVDASERALRCAAENRERLGLVDRCALACGHWADMLTGRFDLIVSNPPYVGSDEYAALDPSVRDFEPRLALIAGGDGLDAYRAIASDLPRLLAPEGAVMLEIGSTQARQVRNLLSDAGFHDQRLHRDLAGLDRCIVARRATAAA